LTILRLSAPPGLLLAHLPAFLLNLEGSWFQGIFSASGFVVKLATPLFALKQEPVVEEQEEPEGKL
jgi:hypothetical protein